MERPADAVSGNLDVARVRPVCVLGMSRAGSSLTTRILNLSGVYLGALGDLLQPMPANPEGFWEHFEIMRLNERILRALGGSWREPPALPAGWERSDGLAAERDEAATLLDDTFSGRSLWGWKDPRNSLTLPFWQRLVPDMRYVICVRNPVDVAASLERRDGIGSDAAFALWRKYVASALVNTSGCPRLLISYESYFDELEATVDRLIRFIDRSPPAPGSVASSEIRAAIKERHWHHRTPADAAVADPTVPMDTAALHAIVELACALSSGDGAVGDPHGQAADAYARRLLAAAASR